MRFFNFLFYFFLLQLAFASTHIRNQKWLKSLNFPIFSEIKRDFTCFLSSHVLKFFQNSKLSLFFVVKMKTKWFQEKKNESLKICKIKCAQKNKCGRQLWDTEFFIFSLIRASVMQHSYRAACRLVLNTLSIAIIASHTAQPSIKQSLHTVKSHKLWTEYGKSHTPNTKTTD